MNALTLVPPLGAVTGLGSGDRVALVAGWIDDVEKLRAVDTIRRTHLPAGDNAKAGNLVLLPMPSFDSFSTDDIWKFLRATATLLLDLHSFGVKVVNIIVLHDISEKRMAWAVRFHLQLLGSIIGTGTYNRLVLATMNWDSDVSTKLHGEAREQELIATVWEPFVERGAQVVKILEEGGEDLLLGENSAVPMDNLRLVNELVNAGMPLPNTGAGQDCLAVAHKLEYL